MKHSVLTAASLFQANLSWSGEDQASIIHDIGTSFFSDNEIMLFIKESQLDRAIFRQGVEIADILTAQLLPIYQTLVAGLVCSAAVVHDDIFVFLCQT